MRVRAQAPGKLVVFGEYAVLDGAPALVMAVDRRCVAEIAPSAGPHAEITTFAPAPRHSPVAEDGRTGVGIVDLAAAGLGPLPGVWQGSLDSRAFFSGPVKLGLGSSAAALCAWFGAYAGYAQGARLARSRLDLNTLIEAHRGLQGGSGSGLDVAAAFLGGALEFALQPGSSPRIGSVRLPNSVGFAGVFAGASASTPDFIARYRAWQNARPGEAAQWLEAGRSIAVAGCVAAREGNAPEFLACVEEYGHELDNLGTRLMRNIVTDAHREIGALAARHGVVYKVSGAGGGDLGIAMSEDPGALSALRVAVGESGFEWLELSLDDKGLIVEELSP